MLREQFTKDLRDLMRSTARVMFHVVVVALSAGAALSVPILGKSFAEKFLPYWSRIENDTMFLISMEVAVAILLILLFNYVVRSTKDRKLAGMALGAGLAYFFPSRSRLAQRRIRKLKERQGGARNIMVLSATGFSTFVGPQGDLHAVLENCLEAKIMLLHPYSEGASARARAILHPDVTLDSLREQTRRSIQFLKDLKAAQKNIKLKLYSDLPHLKLAILGDYIWMRHYHAGLGGPVMPEYVFQHDQNEHGLYACFYQYFMKLWEDPDVPEYDLETDEVVYGGGHGNEVRRERLPFTRPAEASRATAGQPTKVLVRA